MGKSVNCMECGCTMFLADNEAEAKYVATGMCQECQDKAIANDPTLLELNNQIKTITKLAERLEKLANDYRMLFDTYARVILRKEEGK